MFCLCRYLNDAIYVPGRYLQRPEEGMRTPGYRECQKKKMAEEPLLPPGTSPRGYSGDSHETRLVEENNSRVQDGERVSGMVRRAQFQPHPTGSSGDPACLSQNCFLFLLPYAGKWVQQEGTVSRLPVYPSAQ